MMKGSYAAIRVPLEELCVRILTKMILLEELRVLMLLF